MYGVEGEKRPIFLESDAFLYNLDDPTLVRSSFFPTTLGEIIKTYDADRSFDTLPKDVNKNELLGSSRSCKKASDSEKIVRFSPATPYIRSVRLFINRTVFNEPRRPYFSLCPPRRYEVLPFILNCNRFVSVVHQEDIFCYTYSNF
jgi:hypothetical protein